MEEDLRADAPGMDEDEARRLHAQPATAAAAGGGGGEGSEEWKSLSRVSNFPLVNTALSAYEQSKASSRVVKVRLCLPLLPLPRCDGDR